MESESEIRKSKLAQKFIKNAVEDFSEKLPRNKIEDIGITNCVPDESYKDADRFLIEGSVETTSPTGKIRTYKYNAAVDVACRKCTLADLSVLPID